MKSTVDSKLDLMARSLQEHVKLARELNLDFVAQLLTMTAMEIKIKLHGISPGEVETLVAHAEDRLRPRRRRESAMVIDFPRRGSRS
jgi:hypothetical protein